MIRSMTGFGRSQKVFETRDITVEIRSVNHRYYECSVRLPKGMAFLEERLKPMLSKAASRGKVEVFVTIHSTAASTVVEVNEELAALYAEALRKLTSPLSLRDDLSLSAVAELPDVLTLRRAPEDEDAVWEQVFQTAQEAIEQFAEMRRREGERLAEDMEKRLDTLWQYTQQVRTQSAVTVEKYRQRLLAKLREVLADRQVEESRVVTEAAIFADRIAIDEETVRLESHMDQFRKILRGGGAVGRKLDFLVQEMNRESNTIGAKCQDAQLARIVVEMKSEVEKLREQLQNLE